MIIYDDSQPAVPLCECTRVCMVGGRLQKVYASSSVTPTYPHPQTSLKQLQERSFSGLRNPRECLPALASSRGGPCSALPQPFPSASWTQALLFSSAALSSPGESAWTILPFSPNSLLSHPLPPSVKYYPTRVKDEF